MENYYLECHGIKIPNDKFIIPDNITIISFSTEYELGYASDTAIFKKYISENPGGNFINDFKTVLYIFGSGLIYMNPIELKRECYLRNIILGGNKKNKEIQLQVAFKILNVIHNAGFSKNNQKIVMHNPGDTLSNYTLVVGENDTQLLNGLYEITIDKFYDEDTYGYTDDYKERKWTGEDDLNYSDYNYSYYRLGLSKIVNENFVRDTFTNKIEKLLYQRNLDLKTLIHYFSKMPFRITLFVNHCKEEIEGKRTNQQIQRKRLQQLKLLQGIGLN